MPGKTKASYPALGLRQQKDMSVTVLNLILKEE